MPKKVMKAMKKPQFPLPKRGKRRVQRRPAATNTYVPVPYVRHGQPTTKNKAHRQRWGRSVQMFMALRGRRLIERLQKDQILPNWEGHTCPRCSTGSLGSLKYFKEKKVWAYRCSHRHCHKMLQPHDYHPIFFLGAGNSQTKLHEQAAVLYAAVAGVSSQAAHLVLDMDHKPVERIFANLEVARARYVTAKEKDITYGGNWEDAEVDEVDIGKSTDNNIEGDYNTKWEQWGGLVQRGCPSSLRLFKLEPKLTKKRAPGPGLIRKRDWKGIGMKLLANSKVVLHSDGAKAYKLKIPEVIHCNVVHQKKKVKINGKVHWIKPHYTKVYKVKLPNGNLLSVKSGTQIIDRNQALTRKIRSAQFTYWFRYGNMWKATGTMLDFLWNNS
ncbi:unnamed protein product [Symbiodinium sp. CCMP2592]|nr:unnamed protein product [Symbiodinium sp. CCMP2592]